MSEVLQEKSQLVLRLAKTSLASTFVLLWLAACPALGEVNPNLLLFEARALDSETDAANGSTAARPLPLHSPFANPRAGADDAPAPEPGLLVDVAAYNDRIAAHIEGSGPFDMGLIQEYAALGELYQQLGQHERAIEAFEEAEYVARINEGLTAPQAFDSIESAVESYIAMGDLPAANEKLQFLLYLNREHYGSNSLELVPLLAAMGDWHMYSFSQALSAPPVASFSIGLGGSGGRNAFDPRSIAFGNLFRAQGMYSQAIGTLLNRQVLYAPELIALEQKLVESVFLTAHREGFMRNPAFFLGNYYTTTGSHLRRNRFSGLSPSYLQGRNAYERMRRYQNFQYQSDPLDLARILIAEADWHLIYDHHSKAIRVYEEALELMRRQGVPEAELEAIFAPSVPVQLPAFTALPHSRAYLGIAEDREIDYEGHVDVSFELSRYGSAKRVRVLGTSEATDPDVVKRLRRLLNSMPFRPVVLEGREEARKKTVRYYYAQLPLEQDS